MTTHSIKQQFREVWMGSSESNQRQTSFRIMAVNGGEFLFGAGVMKGESHSANQYGYQLKFACNLRPPGHKFLSG